MSASDFSKQCMCGRIGDTYALLLCPIDAPIPFVLTPRGVREARKLRQWDVLFEPLEQRRKAEAAKRKRRAPAAIRTVKGA